jgi:CHAD domain-containing protein
MDHLEVEWQFDAVHLGPVERWLRGHEGNGHLSVAVGAGTSVVDAYLDTEDWRLYRAGYSLRARRAGGRIEATLKSLAPSVDAVRTRREISEELPSASPEAILRSEGGLGERVRAVAGRAPLRQLFEVRTRRRTFVLAVEGENSGEIALDETTIPVGDGAPGRLRRVEVEVPERAVPAARPFVDALRLACGLQPAAVSKFQAGLISGGLHPESSIDLGPTAIDATRSVGEVAFAVMRAQFVTFLAREPGTRMGDDPEELHDMRVATRRLRAAIALFEPALPVRISALRDELGWVAEVLGAVRDLDVQLEQLDAWIASSEEPDRPALDGLRSTLDEARAAARVDLLRTLDDRRYATFTARFTRLLQAGPLRRSTASRAPIATIAPALIKKRYRAVRRAGDHLTKDSAAPDFHRLRIKCKRLRYALEFLGEVYPGHSDRIVKRLITVQDILGAHQDAIVAVERLRGMLPTHGQTLPPQTIFAMGEIAQRYAGEAASLRARLPKAYAYLRGKAWKSFRRKMERAGDQDIPLGGPSDGADDQPLPERPPEPGVQPGLPSGVEDRRGEMDVPASNLTGHG